ncbi:DUF3558 family protein [Nocardia sp. NPDC050406]|uniref:DUF3558 family protein n=1 Tax=Nocardia sp. NPDC050406 TaxID=3364318 RepID=UPI00378AB3F9
MTSRVIERCLVAVAGAAMLLTGCAANSGDTSPTPSAATSVPGTEVATTTARGDGGSATTEPTRAESATTAPGTPASPVATTSASAGAFWDPCTLPDSDLSAAGLNTATETRLTDAAFPTWQMCKWQSTDATFELVIASSDRTIDDLLAPGTYYDLRRTEFYGRQLVQFRNVADTHKLSCDIGTPADFGSIVFAVRNIRVQTDVGNPCQDANRVGARLFNSLP